MEAAKVAAPVRAVCTQIACERQKLRCKRHHPLGPRATGALPFFACASVWSGAEAPHRNGWALYTGRPAECERKHRSGQSMGSEARSRKKTDSLPGCEPMIQFGKLPYSCVYPRWREPWPMLRAGTLCSSWLVLLSCSVAFCQDPPALEGPASAPEPAKTSSSSPAPATQKPATTSTPPAAAPSPSPARSMLVIPGVTAPSWRAEATARPKVPQPTRSITSGSPAPAARSESAAGPTNSVSPFRPDVRPRVEKEPDVSLGGPIPLTLEPLDDDAGTPRKQSGASSPRGGTARPRTSNSPGGPSDVPVETRPMPPRMPGLLGRILGQSPANPRGRDPSRTGDAPGRAKTESKSNSKAAPDADAVAKRRIEQQIRATLGDKVQSVEVRVSGRNVLIAARATRFWQKRSVQRALESLPALAGLRTRIDLGD
jgi:hypothetical protein